MNKIRLFLKSLKAVSIMSAGVFLLSVLCLVFYKIGYKHKGKKCDHLIKANYSYGKEDGQKTGYDKGYSEGYDKGYNEGRSNYDRMLDTSDKVIKSGNRLIARGKEIQKGYKDAWKKCLRDKEALGKKCLRNWDKSTTKCNGLLKKCFHDWDKSTVKWNELLKKCTNSL